jgi:hypothetical protein
MDITQKPNLKPYRIYNETDVINGLFSHVESSSNKGSLVSIVTAKGNTNVWQNASSPATPHLDVFGALTNVPSRAYAVRHEVTWKIKGAVSGDTPLGIQLFDVREVNAYGEPLIYRPRNERYEKDVVISGESIPVVTRGIFKINGFVGTPGPNSGAVPTTGAAGAKGYFLVTNNTTSTANVGKFLTSADADGYAVFKLEL